MSTPKNPKLPTARVPQFRCVRSISMLVASLACLLPFWPEMALGRALDECDHACGHALAMCLIEEQPYGRVSRRTYRSCRRQVLGACQAQGQAACPQLPTTTTTTLPEVPVADLEGRWTLDLELLEVYGCTRPSTGASLTLDISQSGETLTGVMSGNGGRLWGYTGRVTNAGFDLSIHNKRRVEGRLCSVRASIVATGFEPEIPVVVFSTGQCGRRYCGGTYVGTMEPEFSEEGE